ncbi:sigma-70 family RNA polymerase sigma factor [Listeria monocytogenes]|uniref:sigma-70 family RNA polymerase sigma factor n=1 Tax=Listeria monocytogenes TaxID=1639 RepID=UPI0010CF789B|nr:sigma-70 family RNA polymerase sigma factor [Listeria monocytogenes]EAE0903709.1 sigma-70 family RNA polymerase sigma factor [Listeria monocytogenes]EAE0903934.1 sigma-70 family RNA polymerase sigma factor [Listeria monocytogenes]EIN6611887.1 sigma-70 family RNA polymerase sigma factor [Listeria monocytogenes]EIN6612524.1 sigma-70 family RNA polymerase sigma factor [Listeria monocytogenes]TYU82788.1 sigma-70 family RNA polymerase sigma factor [Listeria monocytogenes]
MSNTFDYEKTIEHQFDSFCKTVLRNQARTIYDDNQRWKNRFVSLEALTPDDLSKLCSFDKYETECIFFTAFDYEIPIENILIAQAIESLSKRRQDIILLSYFLDMKEIDIASMINLAQSTVHYHKEKALTELRKFMEEHTNE